MSDQDQRVREGAARKALMNGIGLVVLGSAVCVNRTLDFGNYRHVSDLGPYHEWIGAALIALGALYLHRSWRR